MAYLEILNPGLFTSIQDAGRKHLAFYAIPRSGAMDIMSLQSANSILGKEISSACIEFNFQAADIRFHGSYIIALSGADMQFKLNGIEIKLYKAYNVLPGDVLSGSFARKNTRSYMAINAEFIIPQSYDSNSSYAPAGFGFNGGKAFQKNDCIMLSDPEELVSGHNRVFFPESITEIPIYKGPEFEWLSKDNILRLFDTAFSISMDSNRMGARLAPLIDYSHHRSLEQSVPVLPGFVQWTPSGELIVILQDGQTTGGYPRIAYMKPEIIYRFNQLQARDKFRFKLENPI